MHWLICACAYECMVHSCVYVWSRACGYTCVHLHVEVGGWCWVPQSLPYLLKKGLLHNLELIDTASLASQLALGLFCYHLQGTGITGRPLSLPGFYMGWQSKLWSLRLDSKHFIHWAISLDLLLFYFCKLQKAIDNYGKECVLYCHHRGKLYYKGYICIIKDTESYRGFTKEPFICLGQSWLDFGVWFIKFLTRTLISNILMKN